MSKPLICEIQIVFHDKDENNHLNVRDYLYSELGEGQWDEQGVADNSRMTIGIDSNVPVTFNEMEFINSLHDRNTHIKSILLTDIDTKYGDYSFGKSDKTDCDDAIELMEEFINEVKNNVDESTNNINW